ncbi:MAG: hypothetical protein OER88_07540 [Planctomycetota bacterium]|nr:hypothetical protein [Planctomycetota bacterium]
MRQALTEPMGILLFVLGLALTFLWEPLQSLGWPWYVDMIIVASGFAAASVATWAVARFFHLRRRRR